MSLNVIRGFRFAREIERDCDTFADTKRVRVRVYRVYDKHVYVRIRIFFTT